MEKINFVNNQTPASATTMNTFQDNIENAINGVVESGNNTNGSYTKFSDGTMICQGSIITTATFTKTDYGYYVEIPTKDFPQTFSSTPHVIASTNNVDNTYYYGIYFGNFGTSVNGTGTIRIFRPTTTPEDAKLCIKYTAIGRWK